MFKIDLSIYKESKKYFQLFDILLKDLFVNKEAYLKDIGISPSSYRKARTMEQNIGDKIIEQLCNAMGYKKADKEYIDYLEKLCNRIYFNMYYKIYKTYDEDLEIVNKIIDEKTILFPIVLLMKLFIIANSKRGANLVIPENYKLYDEIKKYVIFLAKNFLKY